ncbi:hypothetical protein ACH4SP_06975 [Streptomyces sp. NPDC021093]|uniref:hypothetical protein n=1 Tax=Streptomyces sp. NPDC021093 TaxID=3365112 RepID=UPI0037A477A6
MNRMKILTPAASAAACLGLTSQAAEVCGHGGGSKREFIIGADHAVGTRWTLSGKWTN